MDTVDLKTWDASIRGRRLLGMAYETAQASLDPSTQNGAFLAIPSAYHWSHDEPVPGTHAVNKFPVGVDHQQPARWTRPDKYAFIEHAERNAIFAAARQGIATEGLTMVAAWAACADCARAIIQAGIRRLIRHTPGLASDRWDDSINLADVMLAEAGVEVVNVTEAITTCAPVRRNGVLWQP